MSFSWVLTQPHLSVAIAEDLAALGAGNTYDTREDAEAWLSSAWEDLAEIGVEAVTLLEDETPVYGPMSLAEG
ncbi:hypothetical protein [Acidipropionibacterium timonense]|uniref:hypothetical protein n=1 Tax=Acidipropionibacterium timonense TaxID=2161818 RepID=UPI0010305A85|nr:hypothetical protein [Acidipropionibacterium timonense]